MKLHKGDRVRVLSGKDRGKEGEIMRVIPKENRVIVDGVNVSKRHQRATRATMQGGIIDKDMPMNASAVAIVCPNDGPTRIATPSGVTLTGAVDGDRIVVTVTDTGPGMDPAEVPHIFEPFWRGDRAVSDGTEGAGLGLALVRSLVDRLGGVLALDTAPGRGATFRISLPLSIDR